MKLPLIILLLFGRFFTVQAQDENVRLVINPKGHTSLISASVLTPDEKMLITVSHDKSVKIWSTEFGNLVGELYGQRGEGNFGQLFSVAMSSNGKYLAVGGYLIEELKETVSGMIRIYDFEQRKLIKVFRGHKNVVHALSFSPDGKFLVSGCGDGKVNIWNMQTLTLHHEFHAHSTTVRTLAFTGNDQLVSGGWDNKIITYSINSKKIELNKHVKNYPVTELCYNEKLKLLCAAFNDYSKVVVLTPQLDILQEVDVFMPVASIFSKDNILMASQERSPYMVTMYHYDGKEFKVSNGFNGMNNTVTTLGFLKNGLAYSIGGRDHEIVYWNYYAPDDKGMVNFAKDGTRFSGFGMGFCAVGFAENLIAFTQGNCNKSQGLGTLKYYFDLQSGGLYNLNPESEKYFKGIYTVKDKASIQHKKGGLINYPDACLTYSENDREIWTITQDEKSGYSNNVYTFAGKEWIITGTNQNIHVFNRKGDQVAKLKGHEGEVRALWTDENGKYLISAGLDQTIRIWNMEGLKNEKQFMRYEDLYSTSKIFFKQKYPSLDFSSPEGMKKLYEKVLADFGDDTAHYLVTPQIILPEANLFIGWNNEWIIWTNDGYFKGSREGSKYIGYHINKGYDNDAKYYPFDQFDLKYNRPDIINQRLGIGDSTFNAALKAAHERRLKKMGLKEEDLRNDKNIPVVEIKSSGGNTEQSTFNLEIVASDALYDLYKIHVYNNDVPIFGLNGIEVTDATKRNLKKSFQIDLIPGTNKIQVSVMNSKGVESLRETVNLIYTTPAKKGNLYLVTIGVSEYANATFNLKYAAKDALDVEKVFSKSSNFDKVYSKSFTNSSVTLSCLNEIMEFLKSANANDQVIIFIAGHGVLNSSFDYYFASSDMDFDHPEKNGIAYTEIEKLLDKIKALKKILIMDTCHSGEVDKDDVETDNKAVSQTTNVQFRNVGTSVKHKSLGMQQTTELMKELFYDMRKGTGSNIISSSGGYELAMESKEWNNGLFTYVLLNGLKTNEADLNNDGKIMVSELKTYTGSKVAQLSNGRQVPSYRNENISFDYPVW